VLPDGCRVRRRVTVTAIRQPPGNTHGDQPRPDAPLAGCTQAGPGAILLSSFTGGRP